ncbi:monovalent cation/H+ antiporter subunit D family protein [Exilibacterium tricleocarpae]|uniref:Monovalent cation/H+ antiporter subunit D family protein n=1 Tax=Exilibacterium tricleocarpae TaxID=2591008 RepID=A0A545SYY6_9GAMM|nr:proton-conducting transporter membrane subunit [Exilibacterium tricleocarpae]TQV70185.1 monovalent cation/H+ antiporter subunit D family protein [Exilibacterium tricleocarpae]
MSAQHAILAALVLPLVGALGIALAARISANLREAVTLATAAALAVVVWGLLPELMAGERPALRLAEIVPGIEIALRVEPLGMLFAALASGLWIINSIYSIGYMRGNREAKQTRFYIFFAIAIAAAMGIAFAGNLITLFLFYEILTLSTYPLVSHKGDANTVRSARVYLGVLLTTSIGLLLPAIVWTYYVAGTGDFVAGGILAGKIEGPAIGLLLGLFVFGVGKAAIMPMHRWLPAAMVAPTPVSALLHAVAVVKAGVFTIVKIIIYLFGVDFLFAAPSSGWLLYAAAFTIIAASVVALRQQNLKRLLAYSTIAQLSYVVMATAILKPLAEIGAATHMVAHAFGKITLFFAAGAIYVAAKKTELQQLRGIGRRMPWTMTAFTIGALSMIGVPPTGGFVSKWYILAGAFQADNYIAIGTIIASTVLNAAYFLPIVYMAWFSRESTPPQRDHGEAPFSMVLALTVTAALTIALFLFNGPVLELERQLVEGTL